MIQPKITIISPTYQAGKFIETALLSVLNQTYKNIEHIIVDCESKDNTLSAVRKYQKLHKHIRLLTEKDGGIYEAMNKGLDLCTGDWIYFMGADDYFYDENVLTDLFEQCLFQEEHIIYGNVIIKGDAPWARDSSIYDGPFTLEKLFKWNICHQSIFYPRSVISRVGYYNPKYQVTSDWDYNIRSWARYKFTFIDKIIAVFVTGGKSSQGGDHELHLDFPENVIKYFDLDPNDSNLYLATSPFYYPMTRYRENVFENNISHLKHEAQQLKKHIADLQIEHDESIIALNKQHEISDSAMRSEFDAAFANLKTETENLLAVIKNENGSTIASLIKEHAQLVSNIKEERDQIINKIREENNTSLANIKSLHEREIVAFKEENLKTITQQQAEHKSEMAVLKAEFDQFITSLKTGHLESILQLKSSYEEVIRSLQNEQRDLWARFQEKENEFMQVIETNKENIDHLQRDIANNEIHYSKIIEKAHIDIGNLKAEVVAHKEVIESLMNSYTWKIGRLILAPFRLFWQKKN